MTLQEFAPIFVMLALQLHASDADEAVITAYHAVLADLDTELVAEAARRLARKVNHDGEAWMPKAPEWRVAAGQVKAEWQEKQRALLRKLPQPLCPRCGDTGWKRMSTGRVRPCDCRELRHQELLGRQPMPALTSGE